MEIFIENPHPLSLFSHILAIWWQTDIGLLHEIK